MIDLHLTRSVRSHLAGEPLWRIARKRTLSGALCLILTLPATSATAATTSTKEIELLKLYAHTKLLNAYEFHCLDLLWMNESKWDKHSDNPHSTAYGIPQLLNMKEHDPFKQVDLGLRYISKRYGNPCKAWAFWKGHRYY